MFHQRDVVAGRQPLTALDSIIEPAGPAQHREDHARPNLCQREASAERQEQAGDDEKNRVQKSPQQEKRREQQRADDLARLDDF
jgi:hypothetical protein